MSDVSDLSVLAAAARAFSADPAADAGPLARALAGLDGLHVLPDQQTLIRRLMESGPKSPSEVTGSTPATPWPDSFPMSGERSDGGDFLPHVFSDGQLAREFAVADGQVGPDATVMTEGAPSAKRIREVLGEDWGGVWLDRGTDHEVFLDRPMLRRILERMGDGAAAPAPSEPPVRPHPPPPDDGVFRAVHRLNVKTGPPVVPPPEVTETEVAERLRVLRQKWEEESLPPWKMLLEVAYETALWVPADPREMSGLRWPLMGKHPQQHDLKVIHAFASKEMAETTVRATGQDAPVYRLSGIEALRWMWATPQSLAAFLLHFDPPFGFAGLTPRMALSAIHPHFAHVPDLEAVPRVPPARLGEIPGARGTRPECVRALVGGWRELVGVSGPDGGTPVPVEHEGGRYLPAFTGAERYFAFDTAHPETSGTPVPAGEEAPFRDWLLASRECDGVILDPSGPHPLVLDPTDLLFLSLWVRKGSRPDGTDVVRAVAELGDALDSRRVARFLVDWPQYFTVGHPTPEGRIGEVLTMPDDPRRLSAFTTDGKATRFFHQICHARELDLGEGWSHAELLSRWPINLFEILDAGFPEGAWLNPRGLNFADHLAGGEEVALEMLDMARTELDVDREDGDGLEVTPEIVAAALQRIDETLAPRVEGLRV